MENQFVDEALEKTPDIDIEYYVSHDVKSKGLTHLMKLVLCAKNNDECFEMIKKIIKNNPEEINRQCTKGWTPLAIACRNNNTCSSIEVVRLLLDQSDIDINKQGYGGQTALIMACRNSNNVETVKMLLSHPNIDVNKQDNFGWTALMTACMNSSSAETVKLLLGHPDMDVNKQDDQRWTALMHACGNEMVRNDSDVKTVKLLLECPNIDVSKKSYGENVLELIRKNNTLVTAFIESVLDNNIYVDKNMLKILIQNNRNISYTDLLLPRILCPLKIDYSLIGELLILPYEGKIIEKYLYYCNLHTNIKKEMVKNIFDHREEIYSRPNNIIALCSEINFKLKFRKSEQIFEELDDKLKFIFDIKNESDMVNKISFYLCDNV